MKKYEAARILDDELFEIKEDIRKSRAMLNELGNSYFGKIFNYDRDGLAMLHYCHEYYEPYYDIASDYIFKADKKLESLLKDDVDTEKDFKEVDVKINITKLNTEVA